MKKFFLILIVVLVSCQPDEILLPTPNPIQELIFDQPTSMVSDGQTISFNISTTQQHQLTISTMDGSVVTKEKFTPTVGLNTRKIYTKSLLKGEYILILSSNDEIINKTNIIVE